MGPGELGGWRVPVPQGGGKKGEEGSPPNPCLRLGKGSWGGSETAPQTLLCRGMKPTWGTVMLLVGCPPRQHPWREQRALSPQVSAPRRGQEEPQEQDLLLPRGCQEVLGRGCCQLVPRRMRTPREGRGACWGSRGSGGAQLAELQQDAEPSLLTPSAPGNPPQRGAPANCRSQPRTLPPRQPLAKPPPCPGRVAVGRAGHGALALLHPLPIILSAPASSWPLTPALQAAPGHPP